MYRFSTPLFLVCCALLLVVSYVIGAIVHARQAAGKTVTLIDRAQQFPRQYSIGAGLPLRYLMLGDSTAMGVGCDRLEQTVAYHHAQILSQSRNVEVTNLGVSGARLKDVLANQLPLLSGKYDVITVLVGANDATHLTDNQSFWTDLQQLTAALSSQTSRLILVTPPNFSGTSALPGFIRLLVTSRSYSERAAVLQSAGSATVVDLYRDGHLQLNQFASDGFHPNASGYALWASLFEHLL